MNYYQDPNTQVIARGTNPAVYNGWTDLGEHAEFNSESTQNLKVVDSVLQLDTDKISANQRTALISMYENAVQNKIDEVAQIKHYDNATSLSKYLRPSSPYYADAIALFTWIDDIWVWCYSQLASPPNPLPTVEEFIASMLTAFPAPW